MTKYDYLIIGGGMTAAAAARAIREVDSKGTIGMISAENHPPYHRPPLTKKLWLGKTEDSVWSKLPGGSLEIIPGRRITRLVPQDRQAQDEHGQLYSYGRLLLATGGAPRRLPFAPPETCYYRTLDDYHTVRAWSKPGARIGIIGGGFIGSEIAASLASNGASPVMVFPEAGIGARVYPVELSQFLNRYYQEKGVQVYPGVEIQAIDRLGEGFVLRGNAGTTIPVDHIIAGIGIRPNTELAESAGVRAAGPEDGGGLIVDEYLRTNLPDIYAAGDAANFYNPVLNKRMRVEHADNAESMGRAAGLNMAGCVTPYDHLPFFYSDMFDLGYEAVGELDPRLEIVQDWEEPFKKGVIYYQKDGQVRGVLLWNTWNQVDAARKIIRDGSPLRLSERL